MPRYLIHSLPSLLKKFENFIFFDIFLKFLIFSKFENFRDIMDQALALRLTHFVTFIQIFNSFWTRNPVTFIFEDDAKHR